MVFTTVVPAPKAGAPPSNKRRSKLVLRRKKSATQHTTASSAPVMHLGTRRRVPGGGEAAPGMAKRHKAAAAAKAKFATTADSEGDDDTGAEDFECPVCCDLVVDPVVGSCGHDFCKHCLEAWRDASEGPVSCPLCRVQILPNNSAILGICKRLKAVIEKRYPEKTAERRKAVQTERAARLREKFEAHTAATFEFERHLQQLLQPARHPGTVAEIVRATPHADEATAVLRARETSVAPLPTTTEILASVDGVAPVDDAWLSRHPSLRVLGRGYPSRAPTGITSRATPPAGRRNSPLGLQELEARNTLQVANSQPEWNAAAHAASWARNSNFATRLRMVRTSGGPRTLPAQRLSPATPVTITSAAGPNGAEQGDGSPVTTVASGFSLPRLTRHVHTPNLCVPNPTGIVHLSDEAVFSGPPSPANVTAIMADMSRPALAQTPSQLGGIVRTLDTQEISPAQIGDGWCGPHDARLRERCQALIAGVLHVKMPDAFHSTASLRVGDFAARMEKALYYRTSSRQEYMMIFQDPTGLIRTLSDLAERLTGQCRDLASPSSVSATL